MKELVGSEKQVAWANGIRKDNIKRIENEIEGFKLREINNTGSFPEIIKKLELALNELKNDKAHLSAKWWIDHKGLAAAYIYKIEHC